jgi:creatinine amidohydrolase
MSGRQGAPLVRLAELTRDQAAEAAASGAVVLVPVGATEQHGPHLPLATDSLHVEHVAIAAAERLSPGCRVVVAPTLPYGCSRHHLELGPTVTLSSATFLAVLAEVGDSLAASGFRRIFFVNGHGGNHDLCRQSAVDLAGRADVEAAATSWWHLVAEATVATGAAPARNVPGHAGAYETSLMLALRRELVREELPSRDEPPGRGTAFGGPLAIVSPEAWRRIDGWSDSPADASAEHGREFLRIGIETLAAAVEQFAA